MMAESCRRFAGSHRLLTSALPTVEPEDATVPNGWSAQSEGSPFAHACFKG